MLARRLRRWLNIESILGLSDFFHRLLGRGDCCQSELLSPPRPPRGEGGHDENHH